MKGRRKRRVEEKGMSRVGETMTERETLTYLRKASEL